MVAVVTGERLALLGGPEAIRHPEALAAATRWPVFSDDERAAVLAVLDEAVAAGLAGGRAVATMRGRTPTGGPGMAARSVQAPVSAALL